jgi:hypothetical protein
MQKKPCNCTLHNVHVLQSIKAGTFAVTNRSPLWWLFSDSRCTNLLASSQPIFVSAEIGQNSSVLLPSLTTNRAWIFKLLTFKDPKNRFQGIHSASLCSLSGRCDNPIPTRFLALYIVQKVQHCCLSSSFYHKVRLKSYLYECMPPKVWSFPGLA